MKKLLIILSLFIARESFATAYYFSDISGDDNRTSTQAKSPSTPWKTVAKLNTFFASLLPGDSVLFKRGETFSGAAITVKKSGLAAAPIVIGSYGTGPRPIITSLIPLSGWTVPNSAKPNVWESSTIINIKPKIVFQNGNILPIGRWPNLSDTLKGYLKWDNATAGTFYDNNLPASPSWAGARVVLRKLHWILEVDSITSHTYSSTLGSKITYTLDPGDTRVPYSKGYWIQGSLLTLDQQGEWYYNPGTKKLSLYSASSPSGVGVASLNSLFTSSSYSFIKVRDLEFRCANDYTINISSVSSGGFEINNCIINGSGTRGINVSNGGNIIIQNDTILNSLSYGLYLNITNGKVLRNYIRNSGAIPGMGENGSSSYKGIYFDGANNLVQYNHVINSGYMGIMFTSTTGTKVLNNFVDTFGFAKDDGGGIYTRGNSIISAEVSGNIVGNGIGVPEGTGTTYKQVVGLYGDDGARNIKWDGNTVFNIPFRAIYPHGTQRDTIINNTTYNTSNGIYFADDGLGDTYLYNRITGNILYSPFKQKAMGMAQLTATEMNALGRVDSNYYATPLNLGDVVHADYSPYAFSVSSWQSAVTQDDHTKVAPVTYTSQYTSDTSVLFLINPSEINKRFTLSGKHYKDIRGTKYLYDTINIKPYGSAILFRDTGIVRGSTPPPAQSPVVSITSPLNNATFTAPATVALAASASDPDGTISKVEFYRSTTLIGSVTTAPYAYNWVNPTAGTYQITAKAYDNSGLTTTSGSITITVLAAGNTAPAISLTGPVNGAQFTAPASIPLTATASDADGTITKVEFYNGGALLYTDVTSPYSYTWASVPVGSYNITAKATDNLGAISSTSATTVTVSATPVPPVVSMTSPANNDQFTAPGTIVLSASASDPDGTITKVEFYNGTTLVYSDLTAPYTYTWNSVAVGTYSLTAKAFDSQNLTTTSGTVTVSVATSPSLNAPPSVDLTAPVTGSIFTAPASITISANAFDGDGTIASVSFYNGSTLLNTDAASPYTYTWSGVAAGNYNITAKATDNLGAITTSNISSITVKAAASYPTVSLTSPAINQTYTAPATIRISANASDAGGTITKVEFYNGGGLLRTEFAAPYLWDWLSVPAGTYSITAKAYDNSGLITTSGAVSTVVKSAVVNKKPVVELTAPVSGDLYAVPASIDIAATASDSDGTIKSVSFYAGSSLLKTDTTSPYGFTWNNPPAGTYNVTAKATDNSGAVTSSNTSAITVYVPDVPPVVSITSPSADAVYTEPADVTISATASDADGTIKKVDFYNLDSLLYSDSTAPYSFIWSGIIAGNYSITAVAADNVGSITTSTIVPFIVNPVVINQLPTVAITSPVNNATFTAPANFTISATASDPDGAIARVDFYYGDVHLGQSPDTTAPYTLSVTGLLAGTYPLRAEATDNRAGVTVSSTSLITVNAPVINIPPTIEFIQPSNNQIYKKWATVVMSVNASAYSGKTVSRVEFYNGSTLLYKDYASPYTFTWTKVNRGAYTIIAKVIDSNGLSAEVSRDITVENINYSTIQVQTSSTAIIR